MPYIEGNIFDSADEISSIYSCGDIPVLAQEIYIFAKRNLQYIFCGDIPVLALVPHLRWPPLSGAGASEFSAACYKRRATLFSLHCAIAARAFFF